MHSAWHTVDQGRCRAPDSNLRGSLQHRTLAQRHRLCDAARYARRAAGRNPRGTRSQARGSPSPAAAPAGSSIAACTLFEREYNDFARSNRSGLCRDATMLRDNLVGLIEPMRISAGVDPLALIQKQSSDDRSSCLENPRPEGAESSLTENVTSPFQAEPAQLTNFTRSASYEALPHHRLFPARSGSTSRSNTHEKFNK